MITSARVRFGKFVAGLVMAGGLACALYAAGSYGLALNVFIDTTRLAALGGPPAPFALEMQFNDGGGSAINRAQISQVSFGAGGAPLGLPTYNCTSGSGAACGGIAGGLGTSVSIGDAHDFFNEFIQQFAPSATGGLRFRLDLTTNAELATPDQFSLSIPDRSGVGIATQFFDVLLAIDITTPLDISTYASDVQQAPPSCGTCPGIRIPAPVVTAFAVPVPGTLHLLAGAMGALLLARRRHGARAGRARSIACTVA